MKMNKKQIVFLVCAVVLVIGAAIFFLLKDKNNVLSGDFQETGDKTVTYDGKIYEYNEHLSNFIFMGIDTREKVETYDTREDAGQADSIFVLSFNRKEKTIKCLSIPRDTLTGIRVIGLDGEDKGVSQDHINLQYAFGDGKRESCELMKEAVSNLLYQMPIQGYLSMNMDGIPIAVKEVGGVEVTVPNNTLEQVNPEFKEGATVYVTEATAEQFVRYRDIKQTNSAIYRMERQLVFLEAFTQKVKEKTSKNVDFIAQLLESVEDYTVTNIGKDMFAKMAEATYSKDDIITIPGEGKAGAGFDEYHVNHDELFELVLQLFYKEAKK